MPDEAGRSTHVSSGDEVVAAVFVSARPENFVGTLRRLSEEGKVPVVLGAPAPALLQPLAHLAVDCIESASPATFANDLWAAVRTHLLVVTDAVLPPPDLLDPALDLLRQDLRVATVSFLSNDAAFLSFPNRNLPVERPPEGRDEVSITRQLRSRKPFEPPVPIPMATGASVLVSSVALGVVGPFEDGPSGEFSAALADFCFRGRQRGFVDLLETTSFCSRPSDIAVRSRRAPTLDGLTGADSEWIRGRHPEAHAIVQDEVTDRESPLGLVVNSARAKVMGLRVLIDGTILGPHEMGTQVTTVAMIEALAARDDVREVCVALPGPIPAYARQVLTSSKVRVGSPADFDRVDIAHRPFQPNEGFDAGHWREHAERVVVTVHDLISFHIGTYSGDPGAWRRYRQAMRESLRHVDGVIVVSEDVGRQLQLHRMPAPAERVFVVANGTEHLTGDESARQPDELFARGFAAGEFLLCLGTNYTHKNRDLAIRAFQELRRRGHDLALVLAGPSVPWGSSRVLEARAYPGDGIFVLAEVTSTERNWLVRHAGLILYATSAEGFGLVPYEAARFGTPTVNVGFGPLVEVGGDPPVLARDWEPQSLADAAEALLLDPALARRQVASCLKAGAAYTWGDASERLVEAYRTLLARPPVR